MRPRTTARLALRSAAAGAALLAAAACGGYVRPLADDGDVAWRSTEADARALLQGRDTAELLDPARVRALSRALLAIRSRVPEVRDIAAGTASTTVALVPSPESAAEWAARVAEREAAGDSTHTGIAALDAVTARLGGARVERRGEAAPELRLTLRNTVNVRGAALAYGRLAGVQYAGRPLGDPTPATPTWTMMLPRGSQLHFVLARGRGDCTGGCAAADYYYATYDTNSGIALLDARTLADEARPDAVSMWDVPSRGTVAPYATLDDALSALGDRRWWQRQHAVRALGVLLSAPRATLVADGRGAEHAASLERAAASRRREVLAALSDRLADDDAEVGALALAVLRTQTRQAFAGGIDGQPRWRAWLAGSPGDVSAR